MVATASDVIIVLTGGSSNNNPDLSIGGNPSNVPVGTSLNNLFDDVSEVDANAGLTDYRCIYIFNNNSTDSMYNFKVYIESETAGGGGVELGLEEVHEFQKTIISGPVTGGYFSVSYTPPGSDEYTVDVDYDPDPATWASNFETAISSIPTLDCTITVGGQFENRIFNITFADYRSHDLLGIDTSNLTGTGIDSSVSKSISGAPVNSIPSSLDVATTAPTGVTFLYADATDPFVIGTLLPEEGFPLWVKRFVVAGTEAIASDGFKLRIRTDPIEI